MTHDPQCPWKPQVIGHGSTAGDSQAGAPAVACQCPLIERVRTDEAADCASHEQAVRDQAIRDCIAAVEALAVADVDGVMWVGERLEHVLGSFPLATGGVISSDATPPLADGCVLPGVAVVRALLEGDKS